MAALRLSSTLIVCAERQKTRGLGARLNENNDQYSSKSMSTPTQNMFKVYRSPFRGGGPCRGHTEVTYAH